MSKEKLEDIKTSNWNICECETCFCDNFTPNMVAVEPEHFDWLIEQAKLYDEMRQDAMNLYKQNNRYRDVIKDIKENTICPLSQKTAIKALESESDE